MKALFRQRGARSSLPLAAASVMLGACTVMPMGPSVMTLPGSTKTVEDCQADVAQCQQYSSAVITANAGGTAAVGAGLGVLFGGMAGSSYTSMSLYQLQRGYDSAYVNCMYARGNRVPMVREYASGPSQPAYARRDAPPVGYPPPNTPPPPGLAGEGRPPPTNVPPSSYPPRDQAPPGGVAPRT